ncbi:MAG: hypothetical protein L0Y79_03260 [Chlorobi bacterium]|nr:hypothetical protein [Chlorobiota bacterium]MCI0715437.1 hypothetical protein [Chlorobiota bacterium]
MHKGKFLKMFALIELLTAFVFITLAIIFYFSIDAIGGDLMLPIIFGSIGGCALIASPVIFIAAKRHEGKHPSPIEY